MSDVANGRRSGWLLTAALWLAIAVVLVLSLGRIVSRTISPAGAGDFHPYWYQGHHLRQGVNPYDAFFTGLPPTPPIRYLDGVTAESLPIAQSGLATIPTNTAPLSLLLFSFSFVSWPLAKMAWMVINVLLMLLIPWLALRLLPEPESFSLNQKLLFCLVFYAFSGTRVAVWLGQTSLLVLALMILSLAAARRSWLIAGLLLGFALSKYSLALPLLLYFIYARQWRVVVTGLATQAAGLFLLAALSHDSALILLTDYLSILQYVASDDNRIGIQLGRWFPQINGWLTAGLTVLVGWFVIVGSWRRDWPAAAKVASADKWHIMAILSGWVLLAVYHGIHDSLALLFFVGLALYALTRPEWWNLSPNQQNILAILLTATAVIMGLPGEIVGVVMPAALVPIWQRSVDIAITLIVSLSLAASVWLFFAFEPAVGNQRLEG